MFELPKMVVVGELDARFLTDFPGFVEKLSRAFVSVSCTLRFIDPWTDDELMADGAGGVDRFQPIFFHHFIADVARGSGYPRSQGGRFGR